jgi:hypothetical protein
MGSALKIVLENRANLSPPRPSNPSTPSRAGRFPGGVASQALLPPPARGSIRNRGLFGSRYSRIAFVELFPYFLRTVRGKRQGRTLMRSTINAIANVTTIAFANAIVRTVVAGVDALRGPAPLAMRLYAALPGDKWPMPGKQKPEHESHQGTGHLSCSDQRSHCRRDESRCRRPRRSGCLGS